MSDDLNKKIKQITDILGQENLPDNIKGLLSLFAGSGGKSENSTEAVVQKEERTDKTETDDSIDMLRKIKKVMDRVSSNNDPRIDLLNAIKPFLNSKRQKSLNNCVKLIRVSSVTRYFDDLNIQ